MSNSESQVAPDPLSREEVESFVTDWYRKLDVHAPPEELLPLVAEQGLEMQFPEGAVRGVEEFRRWYEGVIRTFLRRAPYRHQSLKHLLAGRSGNG